jgi:uncharacterized membrane protein YdjX (TVP38/TMEM64 family)
MWFKLQRIHWLKFSIGVFAVVVLIALAVWLGPHIGDDIVAMEGWIAAQGAWGPVVFVGLFVVLTSIFVPDTLLAAAAGALFGIAIGTTVTVAGYFVAQCIAFGISRHFLHDRVQRLLAHRPKLAAIQRAADREGLRLQLLLRLTPLSPVLVSHVVGITRVRFATFLAACLGLVPGLFVEVYCGYAAKHMLKVAGQVSEHSTLHTVLTITGLVVCILLLVYVTRLARKAIAEAEPVT